MVICCNFGVLFFHVNRHPKGHVFKTLRYIYLGTCYVSRFPYVMCRKIRLITEGVCIYVLLVGVGVLSYIVRELVYIGFSVCYVSENSTHNGNYSISIDVPPSYPSLNLFLSKFRFSFAIVFIISSTLNNLEPFSFSQSSLCLCHPVL